MLSQDTGSKPGGAAGDFEMPGFEMGDMESEKVDTVNEALDRLLERLREIKDIFMSGFWYGLGTGSTGGKISRQVQKPLKIP